MDQKFFCVIVSPTKPETILISSHHHEFLNERRTLMALMDMSSKQGKTHEILTLHMELQANEKNWEWKSWFFSEKSTPIDCPVPNGEP